MAKADKIPGLIDAINAEHRSDCVLIGKMDRGVNGAWLVHTGDGVKHILKLVSPENVTDQIKRSSRAAAAVNSRHGRCPIYENVGFTEDIGSWYIQEFLPGLPASRPSLKLVMQMLDLNRRQRGQAPDSSVNWSEKVMNALFLDAQGWQKRIMQSGPEGKAFVQAIRPLFENRAWYRSVCTDVVHGDFQHYNALVTDDDELTGYVDWEGAGCGDRAIDLSRLLYDVYVAELELQCKVDVEAVRLLRQNIEYRSGHAGLCIYMAFWMLQVVDFGVRYTTNAAGFIKTGYRIIEELGLTASLVDEESMAA